MDNPFQFDNGDFDRELVKSINSKIPTKVMAYLKDGRSPYLTTVYKNPIEGINSYGGLKEYMRDYCVDIDMNMSKEIPFKYIKTACMAVVQVKDEFKKIKGLNLPISYFFSKYKNPLKMSIRDGHFI